MSASVRMPCPSCPWRRDQDATVIPGFRLPLAERLAATCPDERGMGPDVGAPVFACHQSLDGREVVCAGWLAAVGAAHPDARMMVLRGEVPAEALRLPAGVELHESFGEVIEKLRRTASGPPAGEGTGS